MNARRPKRCSIPKVSLESAKLITAESNRADNLKHELATLRASLADHLIAGSVSVADAQSERAGEASAKLKYVQSSTF